LITSNTSCVLVVIFVQFVFVKVQMWWHNKGSSFRYTACKHILAVDGEKQNKKNVILVSKSCTATIVRQMNLGAFRRTNEICTIIPCDR